ncbi:hypothetical protein OB236_39110 [Paenibacillus sp. WQ 127069]|uniref:Uncharacterized protein n=1 Tax=Paenibacillus baimaensis TaxID=2982185 RepID=A0ABT2UU17_9BACL|nr:hypothetical protein [Paenibacillus sp. WQ 127069]MCU6798154.1 hypothetical protein [Paenibacillus sp. WQ 127069]
MLKKRIISVLLMLSLLLSVVTPTLASNEASDSTSQKHNSNGIGKINVSSVPLPNNAKLLDGTYTYSGKVLISYKTENDIDTTDFYNLAVLGDDGTNFKVIFSGVIPTKPKANGIRYMPFQDNKRVLLGDYVLECMPNLDNCKSTKLVPIVFPSILEQDANTTHHWSEIIIAPDNKHMSWTMLRSGFSAAALIGVLERKTDNYVLEHVQIISTVQGFKNDPNHQGFIIPNPVRGGEVKQFVKGGNAISLVGAKENSTTDSVVQDLTYGNITQITHTPGYDETTIFSPDERLGIVMSTRFSKNTDPAIFGLMPRPYGPMSLGGLNGILYMYSVDGVRKFRAGNIGPVLIDINRSMNQAGYQGVQLTTDENWIFCSPMSWHPDGKRAMWVEMVRGSNGSQKRLRKVNLLDYKPEKPVPIKPTTDNIPYGIKDLTVLNSVYSNIDGKIAGKRSGYISYLNNVSPNYSGKTETQYVNFSDDGVNFYNGYEKVHYNYAGESRYEANIKLTGTKQGEMNLRATFSVPGGATPARLLFETDVDGKPKSYGYAKYNGIILNIEDLLE